MAIFPDKKLGEILEKLHVKLLVPLLACLVYFSFFAKYLEKVKSILQFVLVLISLVLIIGMILAGMIVHKRQEISKIKNEDIKSRGNYLHLLMKGILKKL